MSNWLKRVIRVHILRFVVLSVGWQVIALQSLRSKALKADGSELLHAYIPLHFKAGDALQFDWSEEHVVLGGVEQKIKVAHFRLCHSRKSFIVAYPGEPQEMVLDAFVRALSFYGGVPRPLPAGHVYMPERG